MIENTVTASCFITLVYFILQLAKLRYEEPDKSEKQIKTVFKNSLLAFGSSYIGLYAFNKFYASNEQVTPVYTEKPSF